MIRDWYLAFRGFYPAQNPPRDFVSRFLFSARSVILVISAQAAVISALMATLDGRFNCVRFVLLLFAFVSLHAVSNLSNDYFGYRRGHDTPDSPRRRYTLHPIADRVMSEKQFWVSLVIMMVIDVAIALLFVRWVGIWVLAYAVAGMVILILYDATPVSLKEIGLGELATFLVWGPLMVCGGYFAITGHFSFAALVASIPSGLGVMTVLWGKHIDQAEFDRAHDICTLPVLLGDATSRRVGIALILAMYVTIAWAVSARVLPWPTLLVLINLPQCWRVIKTLAAARPTTAPADYVGWPLWYHRFSLRHSRSFGWLYIAGLLCSVAYYRLQ